MASGLLISEAIGQHTHEQFPSIDYRC